MTTPKPESGERLFTPAEMARLCGVTRTQLGQWRRSGLLPAQVGPDGQCRYTFRDIVTARTAGALLQAGVRPAQVRNAVIALRTWRPDMHAPLASMRVFSEGGQLLVQVDGQVMEPVSGQFRLALPEGELSNVTSRPPVQVLTPRVPPTPSRPVPETAQTAFEAGLAAEAAEDAAAAEGHYRTALVRDEQHPGALLNLGNLLYQRGELEAALESYRRTLAVADGFPEAHYNLGNALDDLGQTDAAIGAFERALALDPAFSAAHFNLALAWEKSGQRLRAARHWRAYLRLEPTGESAEVAQSFLDEAGSHLTALEGGGQVFGDPESPTR